MGGIGDFVGAFKGGMKPGPTQPGFWRDLEKYGRLQGGGEVVGDVEIPNGPLAISIEEHRTVEDLELELLGPGGEPVELERYSEKNFDHDEGMKNLHRIANAKIT